MAEDGREDRLEEAATPESPGTSAQEGGEAAGGPSEDAGTRALSEALRVSFRFLKFVMVLLVVVYLLRGIFYVQPGEVHIKLRFGRPVKVSLGGDRGKGYVMDSESGWHIRWPWEEVDVVPISEQTIDMDKEFWPASLEPTTELEDRLRKEAGERPGQTGLNIKTGGYLVSGDVNIVHLKLRVRYRARQDEKGAMDYIFAHRSLELGRDRRTVEDISSPRALLEKFVAEAATETIGTLPVLEVMRERKEDLLKGIERRVEEKLAGFEQASGISAGVTLTGVEAIEGPIMPAEVRVAFLRAQDAASEMNRLIDMAKKERTMILGRAQGEAESIKSQAEAYKSRLVNLARADAEALKKLRHIYRESPAAAKILRVWHFQRMMKGLLGGSRGSFVVHEGAGGASSQLRYLFGPPPAKIGGMEQGKKEE